MLITPLLSHLSGESRQKIIFLVFFLALMATSVARGHIDVSPQDANDMMITIEELIVVDVRTQQEYCDGHIPGALNLVWSDGQLNGYEQLPLDGIILLICRSGNRSNQAANFLDQLDYQNVYDMLGGMNGWPYGGTVGCVDSDVDGTNDDLDNCVNTYNPSQTDSDEDGLGNVCDSDCPNLDGSNPVNLSDFNLLMANWQKTANNLTGDLNGDKTVNLWDLFLISVYWLTDCYEN